MKIEKSFEGKRLSVLIDGKLDTGTTPQAAAEIEAELENTDELILNMEKLKYISSAGLRLILSLHKQMAEKGGMTVINVNETNMDIFDLTGFTDILNIK